MGACGGLRSFLNTILIYSNVWNIYYRIFFKFLLRDHGNNFFPELCKISKRRNKDGNNLPRFLKNKQIVATCQILRGIFNRNFAGDGKVIIRGEKKEEINVGEMQISYGHDSSDLQIVLSHKAGEWVFEKRGKVKAVARNDLNCISFQRYERERRGETQGERERERREREQSALLNYRDECRPWRVAIVCLVHRLLHLFSYRDLPFVEASL